MTYISSQHYLNPDIVDAKIAQLLEASSTEVVIPFLYAGEINGVEYAVQSDGHHTLQAAKELGIAIKYEVSDDPENLTGEALLGARYLDGDYYLVDSSNPADAEFDLVW